jgi:integrase
MKRIKFTRPDEVDKLVDAGKREATKLLVLLFWEVGARVSEVLAIRPVDLDVEEKTLTIKTLRQNKATKRVVQVKAKLFDRLHRHCARKKITARSRIFTMKRQSVHGTLAKAALRAGLNPERCTPQALRHGHAIAFLKDGGRIVDLADRLGLATMNAAQIYLAYL